MDENLAWIVEKVGLDYMADLSLLILSWRKSVKTCLLWMQISWWCCFAVDAAWILEQQSIYVNTEFYHIYLAVISSYRMHIFKY